MADKKISQLTGASTPLAGTEVLPIVQSGNTVKVSAADITVGRAVSALTYTSTATTGTAPFTVNSTTQVANLNAATAGTADNLKSNATTGLMQIAGPAAGQTRVVTIPDANATMARTDAGQTFTGNQRVDGLLSLNTDASGLQTTRSMSFLTTGGAVHYISHSTSDGSGDPYAEYGYDGTKIGSITQNGTTGVLYNITSDYRLKNVIGPVTGSGARIDALEPIEYEWKSDGSRTRGFLAHKFQEVYAQSVTGQKDEVDENGDAIYQNMQAGTSEVIADLVAEIKSLRARIAALESK